MLDLNPIFMSSQNNNAIDIFLTFLYKAGENIYRKEAAYISVNCLRHFDVCRLKCYYVCLSLQDILEYMDSGCNGFLSNVCLVIASYNDMFLNRSQDQ